MNEEKHLLLPMDLQFLQMSQILMSQTLTIQTNRGFIDKGFSKSKNENQTEKKLERLLPVMMLPRWSQQKLKAVAQAKSDWEKQKSYEQMTAEERVKAKEQEAADKEALAEKREKEAQARLDRLTRAESVRNDLSENGLSDYVCCTSRFIACEDTDEDTESCR